MVFPSVSTFERSLTGTNKCAKNMEKVSSSKEKGRTDGSP